MKDDYKLLFSPGKLGRVTAKNRCVMTAMMTGFPGVAGGDADERVIRYYEERAAGGTGVIITEAGVVDEIYGIARFNQLHYTRPHITSLAKLNERLHRYGAVTIAQLWHGGFICSPEVTGHETLSPSGVDGIPGRPNRAMTIDEIAYITKCFADSAVCCRDAGYDGVEIHLAHGYLLAQFMSRYYNRREYEYGGSFENRMRFPTEVIKAVREAVGPRFMVGVRISGDEMAQEYSPLHLTQEEGLEIAKYIDALGMIDYINVSNGNKLTNNANCDPFFYDFGWKQHIAKAIKDAVSVPVIATNTIKTPAQAEKTLEDGVCDFAGMGRANIADPNFMNKAMLGREAEIKGCIGCLFCREPRGGGQMPAWCAINPRAGCEYDYPPQPKDGAGRPVAVVGGGPGGMEAAVNLASRGYKVTLFEKYGEVGGSMNLADKPDHKERIEQLIHTYEAQMKHFGVEVRCGVDATPDVVAETNPTGVFLACGAEPIIPPVPGVGLPNVVTAQDAIRKGMRFPGKKIAVVGTGMTGLEVAEILSKDCAGMTMIDMVDVGPGLIHEILDEMMKILIPRGVKFLPYHKLVSVNEHGLTAQRLSDGADVTIDADIVVLSLGVTPDKKLIEQFKARFEQVYTVGDANQSGRIGHATKSGFTQAYSFRPLEDLVP